MNVRIINIKEKEKWDDFIKNSDYGDLTQSYLWGKLKEKEGLKPIYIVAEEDNHLKGAILLLVKKAPFLKRTVFYGTRGPILKDNEEEVLTELIKKIKEIAHEYKAIFMKIFPSIPAQQRKIAKFLERLKFKPVSSEEAFGGALFKCTTILDIRKNLDEIINSFKHKTRYNIRLAQRKGVEIKEIVDENSLREFYKLMEETANRDGFIPNSYQFFQNMLNIFGSEGETKLFCSYYEGEMLSGAFASIYGRKCYYTYGASAERHRQVMSNYLLHWKIIDWAKSMGCLEYDMGGIPINPEKDTPLYGLYRFKMGFHPRIVEFIGDYDLVFSPIPYWLWKRARFLKRFI